MSNKFFIYKNRKLAYYEQGSGPVVVLLHGWKLQKRTWIRLSNDLSEKGYHCIAIDLPGFGESDEPATAWTLDNYALAVLAILKYLNVNEYSMVAHSYGGKVAVTMALLPNNKMKKLVLMNTSLGLSSPGIAKRLFGWLLTYRLSITMKQTYHLTHDNPGFLTQLQHLKLPLLLIYGRFDMVVPLRHAYAIKSILPQASLVVCRYSAHLPYKTQYKYVLFSIEGWLPKS